MTGPPATDHGTLAAVPNRGELLDVLVVGAGPTGLTLAASLHASGARVRIVDQNTDRVHESRALAIQPRTLEVLRGLGVADELMRRGNPSVRLHIHAGSRTVAVRLFDVGLDDTAFGSLLFVSQAETESVLGDHLASVGVTVERGVRLEGFHDTGDRVVAQLSADGNLRQVVQARYLVGCDGAHSSVREQAGIPFRGGGYPQTFLLADLHVDGLEAGAVHAFLTDTGPLFFFPLGKPAPWRLIAMKPRQEDGPTAERSTQPTSSRPASRGELQSVTDRAVGCRVRLHDPVWATAFRLQHRQAARYRSGRVFLAGDAAHVHSPAGAQGMNTGIQDGHNLGWKLAFVCRGTSPEKLLDSYDAERHPVGEFVLRFTDRAFTVVTSGNPGVRAIRTHLAPRLIPVALRFHTGRARVFRTVSQLGIRYSDSPAVEPGPRFSRRRPRPGDRLPDVRLTLDGREIWLQQALDAPTFHLLLVGPAESWDDRELTDLVTRHRAALQVHRLDRRAVGGALCDHSGAAFRFLRVRGAANFVVRPDGHVGHRADDRDLSGATRYLARWTIGP